MRAFGRAWKRVHRAVKTIRGQDDEREWSLTWSRETEVRWSSGDERVDCFRFDGGYVTTVEYDHRNVTWQLTPGQVPLASALAMARLYLEHRVTPQTDADGRPFIGLTDDGPVQVFDEIPSEPIEYVYLDGIRTLEEFPDFVTADADVRTAFDSMLPTRSQPSG